MDNEAPSTEPILDTIGWKASMLQVASLHKHYWNSIESTYQTIGTFKSPTTCI
jgi:hypothetical protein